MSKRINITVSSHLVVTKLKNIMWISFLLSQFFILDSLQCNDVKDRDKNSLLPIIEVNLIPLDQIYPAGSSITINCTGKKTNSQWADDTYAYPIKIALFINEIRQKDLCPIAKDDTRPAKSCILRVNMTKPTNVSIMCQVDNDYGCSYHETIIHVKAKEKPYLVQPPRHINATEGQDLNITCSSPVVPRPFITWYKDDVIISSHKTTWYRGTSVLMLKSIDSSVQGMYTCRANNSLGKISSNGSLLTVFSRPRISLAPVNHSVVMGDRVSLVCNVTGLPIPLIGWLKDGVVLRSRNGSDRITGSKTAVDVNSMVTPSVNYTGGNNVIKNTSSSLSPTSIFTRPIPTVTSTFTRPSPLPTTIFTRPVPHLTHDGTRPNPFSTSTLTRPILPSTSAIGPNPLTHRPFPGTMTQIGWQSTLVIESVTKDDEGNYQCYAKNYLGNATSRHATLSVYIPDEFPPKVFSRSDLDPLIPVLATLLPILFIFMIILILLIRRYQKKLHHQGNTTLMLSPSVLSQAEEKKELEGIRNEGVNEEEFQDDNVYLLLMGIDRDWEISRDRLTVTDQRLGSGCFGHVDKGIYTRKDSKEMFVAVKTLKDAGVRTHRDDILRELDMLKRVGRHPNVVSLVGACTRDDPLYIIIEFVEGGSLNELLIKARLPANTEKPYENIRSRLTERDLIKMAVDIARGMKHLHDKNCIHRDLAARNILVAPGLVAKISDFGLARHAIDGLYVKQSQGKIPWKWMAPEALQGIFTTKTDVWSFGILLWEIATLGGTPYQTINQLVALYNLLSNGYRMPKPDHCHDMLYSIMMDCWSAYTNKRPDFADIYKTLEKMLKQEEKIYINLEEMEGEQTERIITACL